MVHGHKRQGTEEWNVCTDLTSLSLSCMPASRAFNGSRKAEQCTIETSPALRLTLTKSPEFGRIPSASITDVPNQSCWDFLIRWKENEEGEGSGGWRRCKWGGRCEHAAWKRTGFLWRQLPFPPLNASTSTLISIFTPNLCVYKSSGNLEVTQSFRSSKDLCFRDAGMERSPLGLISTCSLFYLSVCFLSSSPSFSALQIHPRT